LGNGIIKPITEALKHNRTISEVDFKCCDLTPADSKAIAEMLKINRTIKKIDLMNCALGDEAVKIIADLLKNKPEPPALILDNVSKKGYELLLDTFKDKSIQYFSIRVPMVDKVSVDRILYGSFFGISKAASISNKIQAWNYKTGNIFKDDRYKKDCVPSLFDLVTLFVTDRSMLTSSNLGIR
jgi:hypothetical protein